jgi:hypothetical protein
MINSDGNVTRFDRPIVIKNRTTTTQNSQTPIDMKIPIVINDYSGNNEPNEQSNQQIQETTLERQRRLARERAKKNRDRIKNEQSNQQIQQNELERWRKLARERCKRYRARKRLSSITSINTFKDAIHDTQIPGPSSGNPPLVIKNRRTTTHNSQIPGTSTDMNIPSVINDYSGKNESNEQSNEQIQESRLERRRRLARERSKKNRDRKKKERIEQSNQQIQENKLERQRKLQRERCKRYRDRKRLSILKMFEDAIHDTQIPGPSNGNPPLVIKNRRITIRNTITHRIFLLYSWLQKKTGTVRIKLTHFYNSFIV